MKVALYYPWVYLHGGPERVISEIVARSRHDWTVITNRYERDSTFPELRNANIVELPRVTVRRSFAGVATAWRLGTQKLPVEGHDLLMVLCEGLGDLDIARRHSYGMPMSYALRAAFDAYYQESYLAGGTGRYWRAPVLKTEEWASAFSTAFFGNAMIAFLQSAARSGAASWPAGFIRRTGSNISTPGSISNGWEPSWVYNKDFLIPGRIMWTKNLQLAIDAFKLLVERRPDLSIFTLTLAGYLDRKSHPYLSMLRDRAAGCPQIRFVLSPSDDELFALCRSAYTVLYPPFNEDWGLAPIEGMALGKPVIAVNRGGPSETILDGETGYLVDPTPERFARAMERLADNPDLVCLLGGVHARAHSISTGVRSHSGWTNTWTK